MCSNSDNLLYVISAKKELNWHSFKDVFDYLYTLKPTATNLDKDGINHKRLQAVRALDSLGHCDFDFSNEGKKVYVAPPVLVRLPCAGFPQAILAGARSPTTIQQLSVACQSIGQHINLEVTEQSNELLLIPKRVAVQAEDVEELEAIANSLKISFLQIPSAWSLLHFAGSLDDYLATLQWSSEPELTWKRQTFDPIFLQFQSNKKIDNNIYLSRYSHPSGQSTKYYLWQDEKCTRIDPDWGRYAVLKVLKLNVIIYDRRKFIMAVPASVKLPRLLERTLTLCSGYVRKYIEKLPCTLVKNQKYNLFMDIPPPIAEMTATKLNQTLIMQSLDIK